MDHDFFYSSSFHDKLLYSTSVTIQSQTPQFGIGGRVKNRQKVQNFCRVLRWMSYLAIVFAIPHRALYWALLTADGVVKEVSRIHFHLSDFYLQHIPAPMRLNGFLFDLVPCGYFIFLFLIAAKMFKEFEQLRFFEKKNIQRIRFMGFIILLGQLVSPFYFALRNLFLTSPSNRMTIVISPLSLFMTLFLVFILFLSAYILERGQLLEEEFNRTI